MTPTDRAPAQDATATQTAPTEPRTVQIDQQACYDALISLSTSIGTHDLREQDPPTALTIFECVAQEGLALSRLAQALAGHQRAQLATPPRHAAADLGEDVDALRAALTVLITEHDTPDPAIALAGNDLYMFVYTLQTAVRDFTLPDTEEVTEQLGRQLYQLRDLAGALALAAGTAAAYTYRRVHDLERVLEER